MGIFDPLLKLKDRLPPGLVNLPERIGWNDEERRRRLLRIGIPAVAGVLVLTVGLLVWALWPESAKELKSGPRVKAHPELVNWHLWLEERVSDPEMRENVLKPEAMPLEQDRRLLEESLKKSSLFDSATPQLQSELNELGRKLK